MNYRLILTGFACLFLASSIFAQKPSIKPAIPENFCIPENEFILANKINEYRIQNNLPPIPFSTSLFFVAHAHVKDLAHNHPDVINCNEHSWSDKGTWTPCCYGKESGKKNCMNDKPKELTGYKGKGYEMIYWDSEEAKPSDALELWKSIPLTNEMLLNKGTWNSGNWKGFGVGIHAGYASVWFGDAIDLLHGTRLCSNDSVIDLLPGEAKLSTAKKSQNAINQPSRENGKPETIAGKTAGNELYYLIVFSCKTVVQGGEEAEKYRRKGYPDVKILSNDTLYRIALQGYETKSEAQKALNKLSRTFKGIWILKY